MFDKWLRQSVDTAVLILRLGLAAIFAVHGYFKVVQEYPLIPGTSLALQTTVGWIELLCGMALLIGLFARLAALALIVVQIGAVIKITGNHALQVLDIGARGADFLRVGPEYNVALICMATAVLLIGAGCVSVDHLLTARMRKRPGAGSPRGSAAPA